jgi:two-component system, OmpR family, response regulator
MNETPQIMLVEDDESLGFLIKDALEASSWKVSLCADGEKALTAFHHHEFNLCILDIMLPVKSGFELAIEIRKYNPAVPIVFLTAKSQIDDRIRGFQLGADDFVSKPFSIEEFKYRIGAVLKRSFKTTASVHQSAVLELANSSLDIHNLLLNANGISTRLTYKECKLLQMFFRHSDKLIEREVFLKAIWEDEGFFVARSMDVFISRLRKYLATDHALKIENIRGIGYVMKVVR